MVYENLAMLKDEHYELLERLYNMDKDALLAIPEDELDELLFPEGDSPLWDAMVDVDEDNEPTPDMLLAEQIYDILRPASIYHPPREEDDDDD